MCVLPLLLAGVLGAPGKHEQLAEYLRKLLLEDNSVQNPSTKHIPEIINAIRFIWYDFSTINILKIYFIVHQYS